MIEFEHVSKVYETQNDENVALEDINIQIDEGEFVFVLGHSGAGKSTFLKLMLMEEKPTEGRVIINDQDLTPPAPPQGALHAPPDGRGVPGFPPDPDNDRLRERGFRHARDQYLDQDHQEPRAVRAVPRRPGG